MAREGRVTRGVARAGPGPRPRVPWLAVFRLAGVGGRTGPGWGRGAQSPPDTRTVNMEPDTLITEPEDTLETSADPKCKYKLRHNKKLEDARPKKRGPKPRLRSAGMSRYRRKEANARERQRQGEINTSFDKLREKIPPPPPTNGKCEKLRKIDILHVAINYIR